MPLDRALVGKAYPTASILADAERVSRFAHAIGHGIDGVPPTFVTAPELAAGLANLLTDAELGLELSRVLHGEQEYEWHRPIAVGEELIARATIEEIRGRPTLELLTLRTEIRGAASDLVCTGRTTLIVRGGP